MGRGGRYRSVSGHVGVGVAAAAADCMTYEARAAMMVSDVVVVVVVAKRRVSRD